MLIGVPREIKVHEYRVGLVPASVRELVSRGHRVIVEKGAGLGSGFEDAAYRAAGARLVGSTRAVFGRAQMIVKVKEPQIPECRRLRRGQLLVTYLHLAPDRRLASALLDSRCTAIAYETVTSPRGTLPLLSPMSEVAGRMSIHVGAHCLQKAAGGSAVLLGGVPGVLPAEVVVLGGGVAGSQAARMAVGLGASVTVLDRSLERLRQLDEQFGGRLRTAFATADAIEALVANADLVIGAALVPGALAPRLVTRRMLRTMRRGSVLVDISIDQGGCFETSRPTTHADPTYIVDGIVHYCVANMPGAVARTSAIALNSATLPFILALADEGWKKACARDPHLLDGLNVHDGRIAHPAVHAATRLPWRPAREALAA